MNPDTLWNAPRALFSKLKKPKQSMFLKTKTKIGKAINLKIYLLVYGQKLILNLGIPLKQNILQKKFNCRLTFIDWEEIHSHSFKKSDYVV